jgi:hypothetical protein
VLIPHCLRRTIQCELQLCVAGVRSNFGSRINWSRSSALGFVYRKCYVKISNRTPSILTEVVFIVSFQENGMIVPLLDHHYFLPNPLQFINSLSSDAVLAQY